MAKFKKCDFCNGEGEISGEYEYYEPCPECLGFGHKREKSKFLKRPKVRKNKNFQLNEKDYVLLKDLSHFEERYKYLENEDPVLLNIIKEIFNRKEFLRVSFVDKKNKKFIFGSFYPHHLFSFDDIKRVIPDLKPGMFVLIKKSHKIYDPEKCNFFDKSQTKNYKICEIKEVNPLKTEDNQTFKIHGCPFWFDMSWVDEVIPYKQVKEYDSTNIVSKEISEKNILVEEGWAVAHKNNPLINQLNILFETKEIAKDNIIKNDEKVYRVKITYEILND